MVVCCYANAGEAGRRGSSVDDAIRSAAHNRHVSFILSTDDVIPAHSTAGHRSFDAGFIGHVNSRC